MFIRIAKLLNESQLSFLDEFVTSGNFVDGSATTGVPTKAVKKNLQIDLANHPKRDEFFKLISQAMNENKIVRSSVLPLRMTLPILSKYETNMSYGWHVDNAIMSALGTPVRSDIACTLFLSDPKSYDGGELIVRSGTGDANVKLERGDAFLYPATSRHQVTAVTRGERIAVVFWIQSMVAESAKREILYDLELAYDRVMNENPKSEAAQAIQRAQANLVRRWSET
ncbi:MAG: Fe2+-dependent dioxygenase [Pseudomonadales bacterium]|nr:Fe2+-dependent dioxygenase [Pseudomonadales bacterium]